MRTTLHVYSTAIYSNVHAAVRIAGVAQCRVGWVWGSAEWSGCGAVLSGLGLEQC